MSVYQKILAAVEVTEEGLSVLRRAQQLAQLFGAKLTVLNVVEVLPIVSEAAIPMDLTEERSTHARKVIHDWCDELGIAPEIQVGFGSAGAEILRIAEQVDADLILVGHHPHGWFAALLPHTDQAVLGRSKRDLLAVSL